MSTIIDINRKGKYLIFKLDTKIYPYVKINGQYYVNDGEEFFSKGRADNSAGLMRAASTFLWDGVTSPIDLWFFEKEGIDHPSGEGRISFETVQEDGFEYSKTYYESFRAGNQWVGNFQPSKKWRTGDFGYKTNEGIEGVDSHVAPFFNFGKATLIATNLYEKSSPPSIAITSSQATISNITYDSNEYDILLYFTPSLDEPVYTLCPQCETTAPQSEIGAYRSNIRKDFPGKPEGKGGNSWPESPHPWDAR